MNTITIAGQLEADATVANDTDDVILRVCTKEKNIRTKQIYPTYHSVRIVSGKNFGFEFLKKKQIIICSGQMQYYSPTTENVPKGYSRTLIRALPINCFVVDKNGEVIQLSLDN